MIKWKLLPIAFLILFAFLRCSSKISIDKLRHEKVTYYNLPDTVKKIYQQEVFEVDTFRRVFKCIGCGEDYSMEYHSMENLFGFIKNGFSYDFMIKKKRYILKANKGNPFVYYEEYFYYPDELNINTKTYQSISYNKVRLQK